MLRVENLHASYGRINAVRGVTLAVEAGEIVALIGPNGAGKSTTLGAIAGIVPFSADLVEFLGKRLERRVPEDIVRQGIALVPENRRIFPTLTVDENLHLGATIRRDRAGVAADLDSMHERFPTLARLRSASAGNLSGGEQQQLAIARALMSRPKLLLLDEPSLGLAPILVRRVFDTIQDLRAGGTTILIAEQYVHLTLEIADRVYALSRGVVTASGPARELRETVDFESEYLLERR